MNIDKGRDYIYLYNSYGGVELRCQWLSGHRIHKVFKLINLSATWGKLDAHIDFALLGFSMMVRKYAVDNSVDN